jgi:hypothetical protein
MKSKRFVIGGMSLLMAAVFGLGYVVSRARAAGIPQMAPLTYSGILTDAAGTPVTGMKNVLIQLYAAASGGAALCGSAPTMVTLVAGAFQVPLGDECTAVVHDNSDLWVDVLVDGGPIGRAPLKAVPYAIEAASAAAASGALATTIQTLQTNLQTLQATVSGFHAPEVVCGLFPSGTLTCPTGKKVLFGVAGRPFLTTLACPPTSTNPDWGFGTGNEFPMGDDAAATCNDLQTMVLGCTGASSCTFDPMPSCGTYVAEIICM